MNAKQSTRRRSSRQNVDGTSKIVDRIKLVKDTSRDQLAPAARLVLRAVIDWCGQHDECWPSISRLADECGVSPRHCRRIIRQLESDGWLSRQARHRDDGSQTSSVIVWTKAAPADDAPGHQCPPPRTPASARETSSENPSKHNMPTTSECSEERTGEQQPARRRTASRRYFRITNDPNEFRTADEANRVYQLAVTAGLILPGDSDRVAFFTGWCAVCRKIRTGKCRNPGGMIRLMLQNPKSLRAYGTADDESQARAMVRKLYPPNLAVAAYNPFV